MQDTAHHRIHSREAVHQAPDPDPKWYTCVPFWLKVWGLLALFPTHPPFKKQALSRHLFKRSGIQVEFSLKVSK